MTTYPEAVRRLLDEFSWNPWFLDSYWPENEPRVREIVRIVGSGSTVGSGLSRTSTNPRSTTPPRVLEVGCANGYVAYVFSQLGYPTSAVDAYEDEKRDEMFRNAGIPYTMSNLNERRPLAGFPDASFDVILLGEVFEHILNHPAGLLKAVFGLLAPNGIVVLTTPNPSTLANSMRLLNDGYVLWGTNGFLRDIKVDDGKVIDRGDIHYREYPAWIVRDLMKEVGFRIERVQYYASGTAPGHSPAKRILKRLLGVTGLSRKRLFAFGYIIVGRKPS